MSDWLTHLGVACAPARVLARPQLRLALIGALLPDAGTPAVVLANLVHFHPGAIESYLQPVQAPLPTLLLAVAIAGLTPDFRRGLAAIGLGAAIHYGLDLSQTRYGGDIYLLYPLSFWGPSLDLYWPESAVNLGLLGLGVAGSAWALTAPGPRIRWQWRRAPRALAPAALALLMPVFTLDAFVAANANNADFFRRPEAYEGRRLELGKIEVVAVEPEGNAERLTVRKGDRFLAVRARVFESWGKLTAEPPAIGRRVSLAGVYARGVFEAEDPVHVHFRPLRTWTSLVGLVILAVLIGPASRPRWRRRRT